MSTRKTPPSNSYASLSKEEGGMQGGGASTHTPKTQAQLETDYGVWFGNSILLISLSVFFFEYNRTVSKIIAGLAFLMQLGLLSMFIYNSYGNDPQKIVKSRQCSNLIIAISMAVLLCLMAAIFMVFVLNYP